MGNNHNDINQKNIEMILKTNESLLNFVNTLVNNSNINNNHKEIPKTEKEKLKAAYALNLCTVSISQIIEYNDLRFMEKEYESILNNLNIENMPKDEALLSILKQLLDVITFFKIQEGDKKILEKEYQSKMKNAIWNAVPNLSVIVGGNPVSMLFSLASQVGIGYMNYRKEKATNNLDKERADWELEKSALEQFHGLRRELFDTAWRLADAYEFKDEYRITERQITQYNNILLDSNPMRRYERLDYIKNNFKAYPPFIYYLGSAANEVYYKSTDNNIRLKYKTLAKKAYEDFLSLTEQNLLREDHVESSCCLELFDLLSLEEQKKKVNLLERACRSSGNSFDVLQIVALDYMKVGMVDSALRILRALVNEDYNTSVNTKLLTKLYASMYILTKDKYKRNDYLMLYKEIEKRSNHLDMFPLPDLNNSDEKLIHRNYIFNLKQNIISEYKLNLGLIIQEYAEKYEKIVAENNVDLIEQVEDLITNFIWSFNAFCKESEIEYRIKKSINSKNPSFKAMITSKDYKVRNDQSVLFSTITKTAIDYIVDCINVDILNITDMNSFSVCESKLSDFKKTNNLFNNDSNVLSEKTIISKFNIEPIKEKGFNEDSIYRQLEGYKQALNTSLFKLTLKNDLNYVSIIDNEFKYEKVIKLHFSEDEFTYGSYTCELSNIKREFIFTSRGLHFYYLDKRDNNFWFHDFALYSEVKVEKNTLYLDKRSSYFVNLLNNGLIKRTELWVLCKLMDKLTTEKSKYQWIDDLLDNIGN